jgi:hypothetical protein
VSTDQELITRTVFDYFEGWFDGDAERMERAVHRDLVKRSSGNDEASSLGITTAERMIEMTRSGDGKADAADRRIVVEILDVYEDIASVLVRSAPYHEYLHLVRTRDGWQIANALWRPTTIDSGLESLRLRRAELRESMSALEKALAAPAADRSGSWVERVNVALVELSADFREHIDITEGPDGLYPGLLTTAPRLSNSVASLTREHEQIKGLADGLLTRLGEPTDASDVDGIRELATTLLAKLSRHRQRGADLVYEAYQTDIGGET